MYEQIEKPKDNKSRAVANSVAQKKSNVKQGFGFVDNRAKSMRPELRELKLPAYKHTGFDIKQLVTADDIPRGKAKRWAHLKKLLQSAGGGWSDKQILEILREVPIGHMLALLDHTEEQLTAMNWRFDALIILNPANKIKIAKRKQNLKEKIEPHSIDAGTQTGNTEDGLEWEYKSTKSKRVKGSDEAELLRKLSEQLENEKSTQTRTVEWVKQLHVFVNIGGTPGNRIAVFFKHLDSKIPPGRENKGASIDLMKDPKSGELVVKDLTKYTTKDDEKNKVRLTPGKAEDKGGKGGDVRAAIEKNFKSYIQKLEEYKGDARFDEITVIGMAVPAGRKEGGYKKYVNVSEVKNIEKLAGVLNKLIENHLRPFGNLRVQLCHGGIVDGKEVESSRFIEMIIPEEQAKKHDIDVSAPISFSIISDNGDAIDIKTDMDLFDKTLKREFRVLMGRKDFKNKPDVEKEKLISDFIEKHTEKKRIHSWKFIGKKGQQIVENKYPSP